MLKINVNPSQEQLPPAVVTIGNFDGMHLGHQKLLAVVNQVAAVHGYRRVLVTFSPAPADYFARINGNDSPAKLCLLRDKLFLLQQANLVDELVVLRFDVKIACLTPDEFIQQLLIAKLNTKYVVLGDDFHFGQQRLGTVANFAPYGIKSQVVAPCILDGARISSSLIRDMTKHNNLALVYRYLGHHIQYTARVIRGKQLGRQFGVPTINLDLGHIRPALHGIYVAIVHIAGNRYKAVTSIGKHPTTDKSERYKLEAHLLDTDADLYGTIATVEVLAFLREERNFVCADRKTPDLDGLFKQIQQDITNTRNYLVS